VWGAVVIGILAGHAAGTIPDMPTVSSVFIDFGVSFLTLLFATQIAMWRTLAGLRPPLKPLPPSTELLFPTRPARMWTDFAWVRRRPGNQQVAK
jgi:hypothetical protein